MKLIKLAKNKILIIGWKLIYTLYYQVKEFLNTISDVSGLLFSNSLCTICED
jgi:hypothetical protein